MAQVKKSGSVERTNITKTINKLSDRIEKTTPVSLDRIWAENSENKLSNIYIQLKSLSNIIVVYDGEVVTYNGEVVTY